MLASLSSDCKLLKSLLSSRQSKNESTNYHLAQYLGWAHTAFNGACDAVLSIMPTVMVWNLHMATRLKIGVAVLLGMSAL